MKLEHLIQAYNFNGMPVKIEKEIEKNTGVIKYNDNIYASYLLDDKEFCIALTLCINCLRAKTIDKQLQHTIDVITIIQKTIEILGNTKKEEANSIMNQLELFSGEIKTKAVSFTNHIYKTEIVDGILMFSIIEDNKEAEINRRTPPVKSRK